MNTPLPGVLISGASSGIGLATVQRFAQERWRVCLTDRHEAKLHELTRTLPGRDHLACAGDLTDPATSAKLAELIHNAWGRLDAVIHCAGIFEAAGAIDSPLAQWRRPLDMLIDSAVHLVRAAVPLLGDGGRLVLITSIHGERVEPNGSAYAMAKAALNQYCRSLALELAPRGIIVNAIAPGFIETPMSVVNGVNELQGDWFRDNYIQGGHLPLRRPGRADEVAGVAYFLAGPDVSYLTGQVITVDGGLTITF
jgi:3-oxoacyl-[acyl-carrier protein] reductase